MKSSKIIEVLQNNEVAVIDMIFNKDYARDILIFIEEQPINNILTNKDFERFSKEKNCSYDQVKYAVKKLEEAKFINASITSLDNDQYALILVTEITYEGHQFLDSIRELEIWEATKEKMKEYKDVPLTIMAQVALGILKSKLGI